MPPRLRLGACVIATVTCAGVSASGQSAAAPEVEEGGRAFQNTCANCHGPDGDQIAGIHLGRGQFRRPFTDQELAGIIRNGIPGTPMPGSNMSADQAARIVAYLRATAAEARGGTVQGDASRGRALFEGKGACLTCHRVNGTGARMGPDLSDVGRLRRAVELERSLTMPDEEILGQNRFYRVVDKTGAKTTGRLLNLDTFTVQMLDSKEQLRSFIKSDLREHGFIEKSSMPSFKDTLTAAEIGDIVSYLRSLTIKAAP
jgi:cytochrome c oxidase cbb3-type subunit III